MSKRSVSKKFERDIRLVFHPRRGVKLSVGKSGITIKFKYKKGVLQKYVDAVVSHFGIDPLVTDVVTVNVKDLLPPDAPIDDLTEKLSALAASFANLGLVKEDGNSQLAWRGTRDMKIQRD